MRHGQNTIQIRYKMHNFTLSYVRFAYTKHENFMHMIRWVTLENKNREKHIEIVNIVNTKNYVACNSNIFFSQFDYAPSIINYTSLRKHHQNF